MEDQPKTGREILDSVYRDVLHEETMQRLQDECTHKEFAIIGGKCVACNRPIDVSKLR